MIQLIAYTQDETGQTELDLTGKETISNNYSIAELGEITSRNSPFSKTFRLPMSEKNNRFFAHWYNANMADGTFDASKKTRVNLLFDGISVLQGYLQLRRALKTDGSYEVSVFGDQGNFYQDRRDKTLRDLFVTDGVVTSDYDYSATGQNVIDSWTLSNDITEGAVGAGVITIPLSDPGSGSDTIVNYTSASGGIGAQGMAVTPGVFPWVFKPAIQVKHLFDLIFQDAGYSYTSTFLTSSPFTELYMTLGTEQQVQEGLTVGNVNVRLNSPQSISFVDLLEFDNEVADPSGLWNSSTYTYTALGDTILSFTVGLDVDSASAASFYIYVSTPSGSYSSPVFSADGTTPFLTHNFSGVELLDGEDLQVFCVLVSGTLTLGVLSSFVVNSTESEVENDTVLVAEMVPDRLKQTDFIKDIVQRYNLILEADPENERNIIIEPYNDWVDAGDAADWTQKLDLSKERLLEPTNKYRKSIINFTDLEGEDETNHGKQEQNGYVFGRYYEVVEDDFAKGELTNDPVFKPYHVSPLPSLNGESEVPGVLIAKHYRTEDGNRIPVADEPSLFYHGGLVDCGATLYVGGVAFTQYAYCTAFTESPSSDDTTLSLYWDYQYPNGWGTPNMGTAYVARNLFREYWGRYINQIYSSEARVFTAYFYLTPKDINSLKFNTQYRIRNEVYRVLRVEGFTLGSRETTKVELLKVLDTVNYPVTSTCTHVPDRWNTDGTITFVNTEDGTTTTTPSQECCELGGGIYDSATSTCRYRVRPERPTRPPVALSRAGGHVGDIDQVGRVSSGEQLYRSVSLVADVADGATEDATTQDGGYIQVPHNTIVKVEVVSVATQTTYDGTNGSLGATSIRKYYILAKNVEGTVTTAITEDTDVRTDDAGVVTRTLAVSTKANTITKATTDLQIQATGETFATVQFVMDARISYIDFTPAVINQDAFVHQEGSLIALQNGTILNPQ